MTEQPLKRPRSEGSAGGGGSSAEGAGPSLA